MRKAFSGFYKPTPDDLLELWREATFVLDANVLLSLYRYPQQARDDLFKVLESIANRLWIPFNVALEFQRNRIAVIAAENAKFEETVDQLDAAESKLVEAVEKLELDRRGLGIDTAPLRESLKGAIQEIRSAVSAGKSRQLAISHDDEVRERLELILRDNVGRPPTNQKEVDDLITDGDFRYQRKIPPGFKDSSKARNPTDAKYFHDGIEYTAEYGDLIVWRQVIAHAKRNGLQKVVFVTNDKKEDWWLRESGKTLGPQPQLIQEIRREAGVDVFWMYAVDQFLVHARQFINAEIDESSVTEVREAAAKNVNSEVSDNLTATDVSTKELVSALHMLGVGTAQLPAYQLTKGLKRRRSIRSTTGQDVPSVVRQAALAWVDNQRIPTETVDTRFGRFPEFILRDGSSVRGIHCVYDDLGGSEVNLLSLFLECVTCVAAGSFTTVTIVFVSMPFTDGINGALRKKAGEYASNFPSIKCVYLQFDDSFRVVEVKN
ncbi:hypothetical protein C0Z18_31630 [Trinickia dabaoshanensis]|uniref:PIN like domain-containing protein n=1 Tax=Trinickia dabaoshanensis TaxID=564714 RepID=A0A2N7VBA7_9BURK|nr:PIN-like domain-containing protein [Trinickia dabaoshanensis]PMS14448.1 hypothetical protein C0Z18_31630 [Trinickia dabaoshanensis]